MRDPKRIPEVLKEIENIWKKYPDFRLGQLLINSLSASSPKEQMDRVIFYMEDGDLLRTLKTFSKQIKYS